MIDRLQPVLCRWLVAVHVHSRLMSGKSHLGMHQGKMFIIHFLKYLNLQWLPNSLSLFFVCLFVCFCFVFVFVFYPVLLLGCYIAILLGQSSNLEKILNYVFVFGFFFLSCTETQATCPIPSVWFSTKAEAQRWPSGGVCKGMATHYLTVGDPVIVGYIRICIDIFGDAMFWGLGFMPSPSLTRNISSLVLTTP